MADLLAAIGKAIDSVNTLRGLEQKIKDADARNAIADLKIALADIKLEVAELKEENSSLREQLSNSSVADRSKLELRDGVYYLTPPPSGKPEGPYCPRCMDVDKRQVLVTEQHFPFSEFGKWFCPQCKSHYGAGH